MCLHPIRILSKKIIYKGVEKSILFWKTSSEEYESGRAVVNADDSRLNYKFYNSIRKYNLTFPIVFDTRLELPCRKCLSCTKSRAKEWSVRCSLEAANYDYNYFVTLTYNGSFLPYNNVYSYNPENDDFIVSSVLTLKKEHCVSFMKHLRTIFKREHDHDGIRFFMCGEYGSKSLRPHYHYNLFNLPLDDLYFFKMSKSGFPIYRSPTLERCWKYGFVTVQPFTIETSRYTAQYCCKKMNKREALLKGRLMEFCNMSRRNGIGTSFFYKNCDKLLSTVNGHFCDVLYLPQRRKSDKEIYSAKFSVPSAFYRLLKPVTDIKRGLDTCFVNDIAFVVNNEGDILYNAYKKMLLEKQSFNENLLMSDMARYGYDYKVSRHNSDFLAYLDLKAIDIISKFPITRNNC